MLPEIGRKLLKANWLHKIDILKNVIERVHPIVSTIDPITGNTIIAGHPDLKYVYKLKQQIRYKKHVLSKDEMEHLNELWEVYKK